MIFRDFIKLFLIINTLLVFPTQAFQQIYGEIKEIKIQSISSSDLSKNLDDFLVLDVRSSLEYEVMHIQGAYNIPMSTRGFELSTQELCQQQCKIVTYCNGEDCKKSILAATRLAKAGFSSVFSYNEGILNWVKKHPDKTVLLQEIPADLNKLVSDKEHNKHLIDWDEFSSIVIKKDTVLVDVRDYFQVGGHQLLPLPDSLSTARKIPLDRFRQALERGFAKNNKLVIFDEVGKQTVWLQYYLKLYGYKDYYFLTGGINSHLTKDK